MAWDQVTIDLATPSGVGCPSLEAIEELLVAHGLSLASRWQDSARFSRGLVKGEDEVQAIVYYPDAGVSSVRLRFRLSRSAAEKFREWLELGLAVTSCGFVEKGTGRALDPASFGAFVHSSPVWQDFAARFGWPT